MSGIGAPNLGGLVTTSTAAFNSALPVVMVSKLYLKPFEVVWVLSKWSFHYSHFYRHTSGNYIVFEILFASICFLFHLYLLCSPNMLEIFPGYKTRVQDASKKLSGSSKDFRSEERVEFSSFVPSK